MRGGPPAALAFLVLVPALLEPAVPVMMLSPSLRVADVTAVKRSSEIPAVTGTATGLPFCSIYTRCILAAGVVEEVSVPAFPLLPALHAPFHIYFGNWFGKEGLHQ